MAKTAASKDFYAILGVGRNASQKEVRQAYRKLARQYHPDVNPGDASAEARFKEINEANEVLADPEKRKRYDKYGDQWMYADQIEEMQRRSGGARSYRFGGVDGVQFDIGDLDGAGLGDIFGSLFGRRQRRPRKGAALEQHVEVTLEEAFHGTSRTLQLASEETCPTCGGAGEIANATCHTCQGAGVVMRPRRLEVKIPAGVDNGSRVRVAGEGQPGGVGGKRGDLYLVVSVRAQPRVQRKRDDLYVDVDVPVTDAVLGAEVEVPTLTGRVMLKVPPLTQNGKTFRLARLGMPRLGAKDQRGDLFAKVNVRLPEELDDREKALFEQLKEAGV